METFFYKANLRERRVRLDFYLTTITCLLAVCVSFSASASSSVNTLPPASSSKAAPRPLTLKSDPISLLEYCERQFSIAGFRKTCALKTGSASELVASAEALWLLWKGNTTRVRQLIERYSQRPETGKWSTLLELELAASTQNYVSLASLVSELSKAEQRSDSSYAGMRRRFTELLAQANGDWSLLSQLLASYSRSDVVNSPTLFYWQANVYALDGKTRDLGQLINAAPADVRTTVGFALQRAAYSVLIDGSDAWVKSMQRSLAQHPKDVQIELELLLHKVLWGIPQEAEDALRRIHELSRKTSFDVQRWLRVVLELMLVRRAQDAEEIYKRIASSATSLDDFAATHIYLAWQAAHSGNTLDALRLLEPALQMAPQHYWANYLKALIARRRESAAAAYEALSILFRLDPYNKNFHSMIEHFSGLTKSEEWNRLRLETQRFRR